MGTFIGGSQSYRSIGQNVSSLKTSYPFKNGYFGEKGQSTSSKVRHIITDNPVETAKEFYAKAAYGGMEKTIYNTKTGAIIGQTASLADGSVISWRNVSSSDGSPAVEINIKRSSDTSGVKQQKIHFIMED